LQAKKENYHAAKTAITAVNAAGARRVRRSLASACFLKLQLQACKVEIAARPARG